jgi:hypothetical protein
MTAGVENKERTLLVKPTLERATVTDYCPATNDIASVASYSIHLRQLSHQERKSSSRRQKTIFKLPNHLTHGSNAGSSIASLCSSHWRCPPKRRAALTSTETVFSLPNRKARRNEARKHLKNQNSDTGTVRTQPSMPETNQQVASKVTPTKNYPYLTF